MNALSSKLEHFMIKMVKVTMISIVIMIIMDITIYCRMKMKPNYFQLVMSLNMSFGMALTFYPGLSAIVLHLVIRVRLITNATHKH